MGKVNDYLLPPALRLRSSQRGIREARHWSTPETPYSRAARADNCRLNPLAPATGDALYPVYGDRHEALIVVVRAPRLKGVEYQDAARTKGTLNSTRPRRRM